MSLILARWTDLTELPIARCSPELVCHFLFRRCLSYYSDNFVNNFSFLPVVAIPILIIIITMMITTEILIPIKRTKAWNDQQNEVVSSRRVNIIKNLLDKHWTENPPGIQIGSYH